MSDSALPSWADLARQTNELCRSLVEADRSQEGSRVAVCESPPHDVVGCPCGWVWAFPSVTHPVLVATRRVLHAARCSWRPAQ